MTVWVGFSVLVLVLLALDLGVLSRRPHALGFREAATWAAAVVTLALLFGLVVWNQLGERSALEYYTGYIIELSLSVDNLFVFILIFEYFAVPADARPRVLKWGILGAIALRGIMIGLGALLLARFAWITYVFGGLLLVTGVRMAIAREPARLAPERNPLVRLARRLLPVGDAYDGSRFVTRTLRGRVVTPLMLVLLVVEWSDLVFAIDSIPAIFAVTRDPFIVYSSNVFAILGLRAMFFVLADMLDRFRYLKHGVALVLVFIGAKMTASGWFHVPTTISLGVVVATLAASVLLSLLATPRRQGAAPRVPQREAGQPSHRAQPEGGVMDGRTGADP